MLRAKSLWSKIKEKGLLKGRGQWEDKWEGKVKHREKEKNGWRRKKTSVCKDKKGTGMQAKKMRDRKKVYQKTLLGCLVPARPAVQVTPQITGLCNQEKKKKKQLRMMPVWTLIALTYPEKQRNYRSRDELFLCILKQGWVQLCAWQGREFDNSIQPQSYSSQTSANRWKSWWWLLCPGTLLALGGGGGISSLELGGKGSQKSSQLLAPLPRCALPAACSTLTHKELL